LPVETSSQDYLITPDTNENNLFNDMSWNYKEEVKDYEFQNDINNTEQSDNKY